jgi:hypothetical protein
VPIEEGVAADRLTLEPTETAVMGDPDRVLQVLGALVTMGVRIAIDDFGTGYSSLSYLTGFPAHELKIDASVVRELLAGAAARSRWCARPSSWGTASGWPWWPRVSRTGVPWRPLPARDLRWSGLHLAFDADAPLAA